MTHETSKTGLMALRFDRAANRFAQDDSGAMTILAAFLVVILIMVGGIGADLMRNEMERTRLQALADRAVLAAADLDQTQAPEDVVRDYFTKSGLGSYVSSVSVNDDPNNRMVTVDASNSSRTQFMGYLGVDELALPVRATAADLFRNVEISLVLDISGSMRFSNRMNDLRPAAQQFVDLVMADGGDAYTTINLIPYAGQTNPGPFMFNRLAGQRLPAVPLDEADGGIPESLSHGLLDPSETGGVGSQPDVRYVYPNVSSCLEIEGSDFSNASLPSGGTIQTPHFMNWPIAASVMDWGWCPQDQTSIQYYSNNATALKNTIATMRMHDGTGTHFAMKYAVSLLDPSSRDDLDALIGAGQVDARFSGRPAAYDDPTAVKYIVLMTDGQITDQLRPSDPLDPENPTRELGNGRAGDRTVLSSGSTNFSRFQDQCNLAKAQSPQPVIIYTIAFEAPGVPEQQMRDCASSPAYFFSADGSNIADVFELIARQINQLRLTH